MPRRIIRTTRRVQYDEDGEPIETVVSSTEQPTEPVATTQRTEVYEPARGLERVRYTYSTPQPYERVTEVVPDWSQTLRTLAQRQMQMLREFDLRLANLEGANRRTPDGAFERNTWWALWGILMLILGATLVVIMLLIFNGLAY